MTQAPDEKIRQVAHAFPVGELLREEMDARGWDTSEVASRMRDGSLDETVHDFFVVELLLAVHDPKLVLDEDTATRLGRAFDVEPQFFLNIDRTWREWKEANHA